MPGPAAWELPLRALVAARARPATGNPLAIELRLTNSRYPAHGEPRLLARVMRPGARGGWVNGSLDWRSLDSWTVRDGGFREDHLELLRDLYAAYRLREPYRSYMYGYGTERSIELSSFESPELWRLLDKGVRVGLPLIHAQSSLGELPRPQSGELVLDVTRPEPDAFQVAVGLRLTGGPTEHLVPVCFIGDARHGIVCADRLDVENGLDPEHCRLRLVRLDRPAVAQLERMLLDGQRLIIPAAEVERFAGEMCPALRHIARVVSSDGSFTPPAVSEPSLALRFEHGPGTLVTVGWEWEYRVGDSTHRALLGDDGLGLGFRDVAAERAQLAELVLDEPAFHRIGLLDGTGRPLAGAPAILSGLDSLRVVTEVLPRVAERPGLSRRGTWRPAGLPRCRQFARGRRLDDRGPRGTGLVRPRRDDLVDGREVPFVEVFAALARGESRMLLDDGAHFSLEDPRLESLRRLIEEARALGDAPAASTRISRYQADLWSELAALGVVPSRPSGGNGLSRPCSRSTRSQSTKLRRRSERSCGPTSGRDSRGSPRYGTSSSAGSSPTTWGSARRSRRSRSCATRASATVEGDPS